MIHSPVVLFMIQAHWPHTTRILSFVFLYAMLLCMSCVICAQDGRGVDVFLHPNKFYHKFFPHLKIKKPDTDSLYIKSYPEYLTIGTHLIAPTINLDLHSRSTTANASDATSNFRTNIGNILAFSASYRFVTAGFAVVVSSNPKDKQDYASTSYRTATIKYNGAAYYLQFKYIRTHGYTDVNERNSDSLKHYTQREDILVKEFQFEGMYNFGWKKYSYYAPIDYTQRQLKTRVGLLLKGGVYYNQLSADSNLLTMKQRAFFDDFTDIRTIRTTSFKLAPGIGANLVIFRKFYLSAALFTPYNLYLYNYYTHDAELVHKGTSIALVLDGNISLGYQSERFYAGLRYQADSKSVSFNTVAMNTLFSYFGLDVGYRFIAPKLVQKVYKETMPPGM
ncbi:MAG: hypothetical protein JWO58_489 [Chitinophagaceae bacterium]|nr:hypothetical protein [Chitinophagaceae bacterium]